MCSLPSFVFDHVHLFCTDVAATERWLVNGFGAELVRHREVKGAPAADLRLGGANIFLRGRQTGETLGEPGPSRYGTDHFGLVVPNLAEAVAELRKRGVEFEAEPKEISPGTHVAFARGPDQIRIEIIQRDA